MAKKVLIVLFAISLMATAVPALAWHGQTSTSVDCNGWSVHVDTTWNGYVGEIESSSNLSGTWGEGQTSVSWSVTIVWKDHKGRVLDRWSDSGKIYKPDCEEEEEPEEPPFCEIHPEDPSCQEEPPRPPRVIVREEPSPAGGLVCVTYTEFELLPVRYAQYWDSSENWVSWNGWVLSQYKAEVGLWELSLFAHRGAVSTGRFLVSYESGTKTLEVSVNRAGSNCILAEPDPDPDPDPVCPDCPPEPQCESYGITRYWHANRMAYRYQVLEADSTITRDLSLEEAIALYGESVIMEACGVCMQGNVRGEGESREVMYGYGHNPWEARTLFVSMGYTVDEAEAMAARLSRAFGHQRTLVDASIDHIWVPLSELLPQ